VPKVADLELGVDAGAGRACASMTQTRGGGREGAPPTPPRRAREEG
jgi:hypothetical protein